MRRTSLIGLLAAALAGGIIPAQGHAAAPQASPPERPAAKPTPETLSRPGADGVPFVTLRCGAEQIRASFGPQHAVIDLPDGSHVDLPNLNAGDPQQPRRYTNGRVTFEETGDTPRRMTFAREQAVPIPCDVAQN